MTISSKSTHIRIYRFFDRVNPVCDTFSNPAMKECNSFRMSTRPFIFLQLHLSICLLLCSCYLSSYGPRRHPALKRWRPTHVKLNQYWAKFYVFSRISTNIANTHINVATMSPTETSWPTCLSVDYHHNYDDAALWKFGFYSSP